MAQQTTITLVDDLDGSEADEQIEFTVEGRAYAIDLSTANAEHLREALAPYITAARRVGGRASGGAASPNPAKSPNLAKSPNPASGSSVSERTANRAVREWATARGMKISERGRIPSSVLMAYRNAHA